MNNSDNRNKSDIINPPPIDGGEAQRRRHGLGSTSIESDNVLSFPSRTIVRPEREELPCATDTDDASTSSTARPSTGANSPRTNTRSPKRTRRGPNPIGVLMPSIALPKNLSGYRPQDVGLLTHAVVAILAPYAQELDPVELPERVLDVCGSLVNGENYSRRRVLALTATGHAATYLRRFSPAAPWALLGCEYDTGQGRTDLAWQHTESGLVFFDELKTHNRPISALSSQTVAQAKRQAAGGVAAHGELFAGVRVIPLGAHHVITLVVDGDRRTSLAPTPDDPLRPSEHVVFEAYSDPDQSPRSAYSRQVAPRQAARSADGAAEEDQ